MVLVLDDTPMHILVVSMVHVCIEIHDHFSISTSGGNPHTSMGTDADGIQYLYCFGTWYMYLVVVERSIVVTQTIFSQKHT